MLSPVFCVLISYLIGSFPTALVVVKNMYHVDIRGIGDGNMGARNATRNFGWKAGIIIAVVDILKGFLSVIIARAVGLPVGWQMAAGVAAIIGHDFPVFAHFAGGQGLAATAGVLLGLFPVPALIGFSVEGILYLLFRRSNLAASIAFAASVCALLFSRNWVGAIYFVCLLIFIPFKQYLDKGRRIKIDDHLEPS